MLKMEATIQLLHTQIEALDKALALTAETLTLQQKLQAAQAASGALPAPVAKPAEPPPPAPSNSNWLEILLSALAGGAIAGGLAHLLGRRRDRRVDDERPLPIPQERHPAKPAPAELAETPRRSRQSRPTPRKNPPLLLRQTFSSTPFRGRRLT